MGYSSEPEMDGALRALAYSVFRPFLSMSPWSLKAGHMTLDGYLKSSQSPREQLALFGQHLTSIPGAIGFNNHMGSHRPPIARHGRLTEGVPALGRPRYARVAEVSSRDPLNLTFQRWNGLISSITIAVKTQFWTAGARTCRSRHEGA